MVQPDCSPSSEHLPEVKLAELSKQSAVHHPECDTSNAFSPCFMTDEKDVGSEIRGPAESFAIEEWTEEYLQCWNNTTTRQLSTAFDFFNVIETKEVQGDASKAFNFCNVIEKKEVQDKIYSEAKSFTIEKLVGKDPLQHCYDTTELHSRPVVKRHKLKRWCGFQCEINYRMPRVRLGKKTRFVKAVKFRYRKNVDHHSLQRIKVITRESWRNLYKRRKLEDETDGADHTVPALCHNARNCWRSKACCQMVDGEEKQLFSTSAQLNNTALSESKYVPSTDCMIESLDCARPYSFNNFKTVTEFFMTTSSENVLAEEYQSENSALKRPLFETPRQKMSINRKTVILFCMTYYLGMIVKSCYADMVFWEVPFFERSEFVLDCFQVISVTTLTDEQTSILPLTLNSSRLSYLAGIEFDGLCSRMKMKGRHEKHVICVRVIGIGVFLIVVTNLCCAMYFLHSVISDATKKLFGRVVYVGKRNKECHINTSLVFGILKSLQCACNINFKSLEPGCLSTGKHVYFERPQANLTSPRPRHYQSQGAREDSFRYINDLPVRAHVLAECGFFWNGRLLQCFSCDASHELCDVAQQPESSIWHSPSCARNSYNCPNTNEQFERHLPEIVSDGQISDDIRDPPGQQSIYIAPGPKAFPSTSQRKALASAGFYFTSYFDTVECFECGRTVENWEAVDDLGSIRWHNVSCLYLRDEACSNTPTPNLFAGCCGPSSNFNTLNQRQTTLDATHSSTALRSRLGLSPTPPRTVVDPQEEIRKKREKVEKAMNESEVIKTILLMGFSQNVVRSLVQEKVDSGTEEHPIDIYATASRLLEDASKVEEEMRKQEEQRSNQASGVQDSLMSMLPFMSSGSEIRSSNPDQGVPERRRIDNGPKFVCQPARQLGMSDVISKYDRQFVESLKLNREDRGVSKVTRYAEPPKAAPSELDRNSFLYLGNVDHRRCNFSAEVFHSKDSEQSRYFTNNPIPQQQSLNTRWQSFPCSNPSHPNMRSETVRRETFNGRWPAARMVATPLKLAQAGFFFLGEKDCVKCWYCDVGLQHWKIHDEPWVEHAKWFPSCQFLLSVKGKHFVYQHLATVAHSQRQITRRHDGSPVDPPNTVTNLPVNDHGIKDQTQNLLIFSRQPNIYSTASGLLEDAVTGEVTTEEQLRGIETIPQPIERWPSLTSSLSDDIDLYGTSTSSENTSIIVDEDKNCKMCFRNEADTVFAPCGHICCCRRCGEETRICPLCRVGIQGVTSKTYWKL